MTPLFRKLNLTTQPIIHVLNAPASFEPALPALAGVLELTHRLDRLHRQNSTGVLSLFATWLLEGKR